MGYGEPHYYKVKLDAALTKVEELEDANKDKAQLLARCFAEKKELQKRNTELLTYCEKLDEHEATLQARIEEMEAALVGCNITISNLMKENDDE